MTDGGSDQDQGQAGKKYTDDAENQDTSHWNSGRMRYKCKDGYDRNASQTNERRQTARRVDIDDMV